MGSQLNQHHRHQYHHHWQHTPNPKKLLLLLLSAKSLEQKKFSHRECFAYSVIVSFLRSMHFPALAFMLTDFPRILLAPLPLHPVHVVHLMMRTETDIVAEETMAGRHYHTSSSPSYATWEHSVIQTDRQTDTQPETLCLVYVLSCNSAGITVEWGKSHLYQVLLCYSKWIKSRARRHLRNCNNWNCVRALTVIGRIYPPPCVLEMDSVRAERTAAADVPSRQIKNSSSFPYSTGAVASLDSCRLLIKNTHYSHWWWWQNPFYLLLLLCRSRLLCILSGNVMLRTLDGHV